MPTKYIVHCPRCKKDHSNSVDQEKLDGMMKGGAKEMYVLCKCTHSTSLIGMMVPLDVENPEHVQLRKKVKTKW